MPLVAVPNVSEGRRADVITALRDAVEASDGRVLDVHADPAHGRSVFTITAGDAELIRALNSLAATALAAIDLRTHEGVHPRLGALDVCPLVPVDRPMREAVRVALEVGAAIAALGIPVYFYGAAATGDDVDLPSLRRGGVEALIARRAPDLGPRRSDPRTGVTCVGARGPLIAFNVNLDCGLATAQTIAARTRTSGGGPAGVRALGFELGPHRSQISMNLVDPAVTGIDAAFGHVAATAMELGASVIATEIVGLVPERFLPEPDAEAARFLIEPGRSLEAAIAAV